ncbi:MAG: calcium-binding protein [Pseudomonadota bacterium]
MLGLFFLSLIGLTFVFDSDDASDETSDDTADTSETSETDVEIVPLDVVLADGDSQSGTGGDDTFSGGDLENVFVAAGAGDDLIESSGANDNVTIEGGAGDDTITGPTGADYTARANYDGSQIDGGAGDDLVEHLNGDVTILGGEGDDIIRNVDVSLVDGGNGDDLLEELDANRVLGGEGDDVIRSVNASFVDGGAGDDVIRTRVARVEGGDGNDDIRNTYYYGAIEGGAGDDTIGGGPAGSISAGDGNDVVYAGMSPEPTSTDLGAGNDTLLSSAVDDSFIGLLTPDGITTGDGSDVVRYSFEHTGAAFQDAVEDEFWGAGNVPTVAEIGRIGSVADFEPGVDKLEFETDLQKSDGYEFVGFDIIDDANGATVQFQFNHPLAEDGATVAVSVRLSGATGVTADDITVIDATASS